METNDYIVIESTYPHALMLHLNKVLQGDIQLLKDQPSFFSLYCQAYPGDGQELFLLETAYRHGIIDMFFEKNGQPLWGKRVFLETSLRRLVRHISERDAVMLLESLMFQFHWDISMRIKRQWNNPPEEQADFHSKMNIAGKGTPEAVEGAWQEAGEHAGEEMQTQRSAAPDMEMAGMKGVQGIPDRRENGPERPGRSPQDKSGVSSDGRPQQEQTRSGDDAGEGIDDITVHIQRPEQAKFYPQMNQRLRRILKKAIGGDASSQCGMGDYYAADDSEHRDYQEALRWYKLAAYHGNDRAIFEMGKLYSLRRPDIPYMEGEAFRWFKSLAERGFPTAQCILGMKYWLGDGVESSLSEAVRWLELAAKQRHETAIRHLGDLYASVKDDKNADKWYRIGAGYGDAYCLGKRRK